VLKDKDRRLRRALIVRRARAMRERARYAALRQREGMRAQVTGFGLLTDEEEGRIDSLAAALAEVAA
jgi:hypothetical protein